MNIDMTNIITAALSSVIGSAITAFFSRKKSVGIKKELKATKAEIAVLKTRLNELTTNPLTLKEGIYYDADGNTYCPACYGSPYDRTPLSILNQQSSWILYRCPKCDARYQKGTPPQPQHKHWDPLA
jgi:hypothetical protein